MHLNILLAIIILITLVKGAVEKSNIPSEINEIQNEIDIEYEVANKFGVNTPNNYETDEEITNYEYDDNDENRNDVNEEDEYVFMDDLEKATGHLDDEGDDDLKEEIKPDDTDSPAIPGNPDGSNKENPPPTTTTSGINEHPLPPSPTHPSSTSTTISETSTSTTISEISTSTTISETSTSTTISETSTSTTISETSTSTISETSTSTTISETSTSTTISETTTSTTTTPITITITTTITTKSNEIPTENPDPTNENKTDDKSKESDGEDSDNDIPSDANTQPQKKKPRKCVVIKNKLNKN